MTKISASILIFLALFAFVGAEQFQTIDFDQGKLRLRSLASTPSFDFVNHTNLSTVNVNLGKAYLERAKIDTTTTKTEMTIFLSSSATTFCSNCDEFVKFQCDENACGAETSTYQQTTHPFYYFTKGTPFTLNVTIGADATAWQLKSSALLYNTSYRTYNSFSYPYSGSVSYIQDKTTYGVIGMGIHGDSALNFAGDHPLFSVVVNGAGTGKLIFGKDTSKIDTSKTSQAVTTDTNWTMAARNVSIGSTVYWKETAKPTNVIFDLNFPGLGLPSDLYSDFMTNLTKQHNVALTDKVETSYSTYGNIQYNYIYKGDISKLSSIVIGLDNNQTITIPPQVYTRKLAEGVYNLLIHSVSYTYYADASNYPYWVILGSAIMSNYYTVFEKTATGEPTVTLYPYSGASSSSTTTTSSWKTILIVVVVVLVALVVLSLAFKKKNNFTKSDLGVELRAARV